MLCRLQSNEGGDSAALIVQMLQIVVHVRQRAIQIRVRLTSEVSSELSVGVSTETLPIRPFSSKATSETKFAQHSFEYDLQLIATPLRHKHCCQKRIKAAAP